MQSVDLASLVVLALPDPLLKTFHIDPSSLQDDIVIFSNGAQARASGTASQVTGAVNESGRAQPLMLRRALPQQPSNVPPDDYQFVLNGIVQVDSMPTYLDSMIAATKCGLQYFREKLHALMSFIAPSFETAIDQEKSAIWATLITDIITVAAALGALALPMSLNVIEATRSRYKSPSVLKLGSTLSNTDPKSLNKHLFIALFMALTAKILLSARVLETATLAPLLTILALYFCVIIIKVYNHLKFTYIFISNINSIHTKTLALIEKYSSLTFLAKPSRFKIINWLRIHRAAKMPIQNIIPSFVELDTYFICTNTEQSDINRRLTDLSYKALDALENENAVTFMRHLLDSFPPLLSSVENSREVDIYQTVSGLYLYLIMNAILRNESFASHIHVIERIARFKEGQLPAEGRFCRNGRLFLHFAHKAKDQASPFPHLLRHFKVLISSATREQPENIPTILSNIGNVIQFKGNYQKGAWDLPSEVPELWRYPAMIELNRLFEDAYKEKGDLGELKKTYETDHKNKIIRFIEDAIQDNTLLVEKLATLDNAINRCWEGIELNRFASDIEAETLRTLAHLLIKEPELFVDCRELSNPAGARAINVGHSPIPSSIGACISSFLNPSYFDYRIFWHSDLQDYKVVDAIGALIVYELWRDYIIQKPGSNILPPISCPALPDRTLGEFKSASTRIPLLEDSLLKALDNSRLSAKLQLLPEQRETLRKLALELHEKTKTAIEAKVKNILTTQKLNNKYLDDFISGYKDELRKCINNYPLFNNIKLANVEPIVINLNLPREAFLAGGDTHYILDNSASPIVRDINIRLCSKILSSNPNTLSSSTTLPTRDTAWIICSEAALDDFKNQGFEITGRHLTWPNGAHKCSYFKAYCKTNSFYPVRADESLVRVSYFGSDSELPIKISVEDNKEHVTFRIEHFIDT
ncbi:hypothetical protein IR012_00875 [Pseudomonas putida]|uniref:hypothetical protein n=1 Tax=Pseudomonas putida TaxID=303 RepID=UPI0018A8EE2C|nr:hypothetical protein [Pseudomonas putida]MBF8668309.1 hypothetical protein [Pseudomonas putida]MBF8710872.1 hypothetical protein [Pseudomonas putida]